MRTSLACLSLLILLSSPASAQDHLAPDVNAFVEPDFDLNYLIKTRHIFKQAFEEGVILRSLTQPSFRNEYAIGIKLDGEQYEAFVLEPSSNIWNTEVIGLYKDGAIKEIKDGQEVPPEKSKVLKEHKAKTPADFRTIKATRTARPLPKELAEEIKAVWEKMLLDVRHPEEPIIGNDGETHYFSTYITWR